MIHADGHICSYPTEMCLQCMRNRAAETPDYYFPGVPPKEYLPGALSNVDDYDPPVSIAPSIHVGTLTVDLGTSGLS
jgi:hypothetical protein